MSDLHPRSEHEKCAVLQFGTLVLLALAFTPVSSLVIFQGISDSFKPSPASMVQIWSLATFHSLSCIIHDPPAPSGSRPDCKQYPPPPECVMATGHWLGRETRLLSLRGHSDSESAIEGRGRASASARVSFVQPFFTAILLEMCNRNSSFGVTFSGPHTSSSHFSTILESDDYTTLSTHLILKVFTLDFIRFIIGFDISRFPTSKCQRSCSAPTPPGTLNIEMRDGCQTRPAPRPRPLVDPSIRLVWPTDGGPGLMSNPVLLTMSSLPGPGGSSRRRY